MGWFGGAHAATVGETADLGAGTAHVACSRHHGADLRGLEAAGTIAQVDGGPERMQ